MASLTTSSLLLLLPFLLLAVTDAAVFTVVNQCSYTVWAAAVPAGGGRQLNPGQSWQFNVPAGTTAARVWPRTGCSFDGSGRGHCQTGDCGGVLACTGYGQAPNTLAEFSLNQSGNLDYFDISIIDGFNVPLDFLPDSAGCSKGPHCSADITSQCPAAIRVPGGCNNACPGSVVNNCGPSDNSKFFKRLCPDAFTYPTDYQGTTFTCPGGTNYKVTFCPSS